MPDKFDGLPWSFLLQSSDFRAKSSTSDEWANLPSVFAYLNDFTTIEDMLLLPACMNSDNHLTNDETKAINIEKLSNKFFIDQRDNIPIRITLTANEVATPIQIIMRK